MRLNDILIVILLTAALSLVFHSATPAGLGTSNDPLIFVASGYEKIFSDATNAVTSRVTNFFSLLTTSNAQAQLDPPSNAGQPRTYYTCDGGSCVKKFGKGVSECRDTSDCRTQRLGCVGNTCTILYEPGDDECSRPGVPCDAGWRKTCVNYGVGPQCVALPGPPKANEVTCDDNQDCIDADIPPIQDFPSSAPLNFCGANGQGCECTLGELPIDPALIKSFNTMVHAEQAPTYFGQISWANRWQRCGSPLCAVDLRVGSTAAEAYQTALAGVPVFSPINGVVREVYELQGGYGQCIVIGVN